MEHQKRQKENNEGEDMITQLPEALVSIILSLLPTKDAVRTSILSKRWIHLWKSITNLDLQDSAYYSCNKEEMVKMMKKKKKKKKNTGVNKSFVNFVDRALLFTKSSGLESFSLVVDDRYDSSLVNTWIFNALNTSLKKLCFHSQKSECSLSSVTSDSLFNSKLLEELVMSIYHFGFVMVSSYIHLGHLKSLKLSGIVFAPLDHWRVFTLSFPLLQNLEAVNCTWLGATHVTFKVPMIKSVFMQQRHRKNRLPSQIQNDYHIVLHFDASHFTDFTYYGDRSQYAITFSDPSSVCNANVNIKLSSCSTEEIPHVFRLLKQFSQVKHLTFEGFRVLSQPSVARLPVFEMLNHLELGSVEVVDLLAFLLKSPYLKTLIFKSITDHQGLQTKIDQKSLNPAVVPDCVRYTLEMVEFGEFKGLDHELCLAKFFMENGLVLKRISLSVAARIGKSKAIEEFRDKLFSSMKGFSFAIVDFSYNNKD